MARRKFNKKDYKKMAQNSLKSNKTDDYKELELAMLSRRR